MKTCEEYEIELSSLLDGEAAPETAAEAVEHALGCPSCGAFFRAARRLAEPARALAVDLETPSRERAEALWREIERVAAPPAPSPVGTGGIWSRGWRAAALVAIGLGGGYLSSTLGTGGSLATAGASSGFVTASSRTGDAMDERRFVALADELMRAEPRYQRAMLEILRLVPALETGEGLGDAEGRPIVRARNDRGPLQGEL